MELWVVVVVVVALGCTGDEGGGMWGSGAGGGGVGGGEGCATPAVHEGVEAGPGLGCTGACGMLQLVQWQSVLDNVLCGDWPWPAMTLGGVFCRFGAQGCNDCTPRAADEPRGVVVIGLNVSMIFAEVLYVWHARSK